jgi:hypothetical protein
MDLQPSRNVGLENQLQAIQLGASLYDRAQTQKRMMEQLRVQTAESVIQRQGMELQNKIRDITLTDTIEERQAQVDEFKVFSDLSKQVGSYLDNPESDAKFPVIPAFKSKQYRIEADKMLNNLEKYSARAKLLKATSRAEAQADAMTAAQYNIAAKYGAFKFNPQTGKQDIDYDIVNKIAAREREAALAQTEAKTTSITGNLELAKNNLNRLVKEGGDKNAIAEATLNYKKALAEESSSLNREKFDFTKGVQLEKLANERVRLDQLRDRNDIYRQKVLQPAKVGDVKLNAVDDRLVKKFADDIANKQSISDAIGYEIGILEDPTVSEYVALNSARSIAKVLNSAEGKDAVGLEESKRLLSELDLFGIKRAIEGGKLFGADVDSFVEKIKIKKGELDGRVQSNMGRVNEIYQKYGKPTPAGTSQTPSRGTMITGGTPQATSRTNAPAMSPSISGTNSLSEISFESTAEARAKGKKTGDFVIIKGVKGNLK